MWAATIREIPVVPITPAVPWLINFNPLTIFDAPRQRGEEEVISFTIGELRHKCFFRG